MSKGWVHRAGLRTLNPIVATSGIPDEQSDLWILPTATLPRWAATDRLTPLPAELLVRGGSFRWSGLLPLYREQLPRWKDGPVAAPLRGDAPMCFYRKDLFTEDTHRNGFERQTRRKLEPPATWDDFAAIAEYFRDHCEEGKRLSSLPALPARDEELDRLYYTIAASTARKMLDSDEEEGKRASDDDLFAFHFDIETGRPLISAPGFVSALTMLQRLQSCRPEKAEAVPQQSFLDGKAVLCLADARLIGAIQKSPLRDRVGVCRVPGSRAYYSSWTGQMHQMSEDHINRIPYLGTGAFLLAVPRSSRHPEIAFELLEELGGREIGQQIVLDPRWGGGATRLEHLDEHFDSWQLSPADTEQVRTALRETLQSTIRNPLICLRLPREHEFRAALTTRLRSALVAGKARTTEDATAVLRAVADDWENLIRQHPEEHKKDYRRSLGLTR
jgi:ABC-type glycerol-3-phosphate transport system substrate-binding protein